MQLTIHILIMSKDVVLNDLPKTLTVLQLKRKIKDHQFIPMSYQRLFSCGCEMLDDLSLEEYKLADQSRVDLLGRMEAGCVFVEFPNGDDHQFKYTGSSESLFDQVDRVDPEHPPNHRLYHGIHPLDEASYGQLFTNQTACPSLVTHQNQVFLSLLPKKLAWFEVPYQGKLVPLQPAPTPTVESPKKRGYRNQRKSSSGRRSRIKTWSN